MRKLAVPRQVPGRRVNRKESGTTSNLRGNLIRMQLYLYRGRRKRRKRSGKSDSGKRCDFLSSIYQIPYRPRRLQLVAASNSKMNRKRKKRLDKYIVSHSSRRIIPLTLSCSLQEKKLRKEEHLAVLEKLSCVCLFSLIWYTDV
jgi:hypothetical protein